MPAGESATVLRADAARNRERIIAAAMEVFAERGLEASTAEIAARAGVGEATLFRRFPTKDDLVTAIIGVQFEESAELATECLEDDDPWRGVERFLYGMAERASVDHGVAGAAKERCMASPSLAGERRRIIDLTSQLVRRAQKADVLRDDVAGQDLIFLMAAVASLAELPFPGLRADLWKRYLGIFLDGLRPEAATKLRPGAPPRKLIEASEVD
ncbi:MAG TPA: helix-turn-helix domain-containing protein [Solirubrobacterales bacterium]|jgi:AcrR family transcriptional regulator|nr:helix-turn-helix domain-containing protein [Solirubrobacterales bacterium]